MNTGSSSSISSSCSGTTTTDPYGMGNYVSKLYGSLNCGTLICTGGSNFTFTVTGYYNDYNTEPRTGDIITVYTSSGTGSTSQILNSLDGVLGSTIPTTMLPNFTPDTIVVNSLVRTVLNVGAPTSIQFNITMPTRLEKGGYIQVSVPST